MVLVTMGRGNRFAHMEDVYNCEETICKEQGAAYQAHSEAQFAILREQIEALTKQLSIGGGRERHRHIPLPHSSVEEDEQSMEDEDRNPFVEHGVCRCQPLVQAYANQWESSFKLDILESNGGLQAKELLDWIAAIGEILDFKGVPEDQRVSLVTTKSGTSCYVVTTIKAIEDMSRQRENQYVRETVETHAAGLFTLQLYPNHISMAAEFKPRFKDRKRVHRRILQIFDMC
jgi:hypothetical protein